MPVAIHCSIPTPKLLLFEDMEDKLHSLQTEFDSTFNPRRLPEQELDIFYPLDIDEQQKFNPPSLVHGRNLDTLKHKTRNANLPTNLPHFLHNIDLELKHISEKVRKLRFNSKMQIAKPRMKHGHNEQNFWIHHPRITLRKEDYNLYKLALRNDAEDSHALYYYLDYFSKLRYATPTFAIVASTAELKTLPDPDDEKLRSLLDAMAIERSKSLLCFHHCVF